LTHAGASRVRPRLAHRVGRFSRPVVSPVDFTRVVVVHTRERVREVGRRKVERRVRKRREESVGVAVRLFVPVLRVRDR